MKLRNLTVVRNTGAKLLAGLLAIGLTIGTPISVLATDIQTEAGLMEISNDYRRKK